MDFLEDDHEETENHLWTIATVFKLEKCTLSLIWFIALRWEIININIEVYDDSCAIHYLLSCTGACGRWSKGDSLVWSKGIAVGIGRLGVESWL